MGYSSTETGALFLSFLDEARNKFKGTEIWWRGHSSTKYQLVPGIFRRSDAKIVEQDFSQRFRRLAPARHNDCPPTDDGPSWLFLMQHHHLPTRLLDWSESILTAIYFAARSHPDQDGVIWALSPNRLNINQFNQKGIFEPNSKPISELVRPAFVHHLNPINKIAALNTFQINPRMLAQLSVMTIHGFEDPLESINGKEDFLMKLEIPAVKKSHYLELLYDFGVHTSTLFPDLDHLSMDISQWDYNVIE